MTPPRQHRAGRSPQQADLGGSAPPQAPRRRDTRREERAPQAGRLRSLIGSARCQSARRRSRLRASSLPLLPNAAGRGSRGGPCRCGGGGGSVVQAGACEPRASRRSPSPRCEQPGPPPCGRGEGGSCWPAIPGARQAGAEPPPPRRFCRISPRRAELCPSRRPLPQSFHPPPRRPFYVFWVFVLFCFLYFFFHPLTSSVFILAASKVSS